MSGTHIVPPDQCILGSQEKHVICSTSALLCTCLHFHVQEPFLELPVLRPFPSSSSMFHLPSECFVHLIHTCELSFLRIGDLSDFLQPLCRLAGKQSSQEASAAQNVTNAAESHPSETHCFHTSSLGFLRPLCHEAIKEMHVRVGCSQTINMEGNNNIKKAFASSA